MRVNIVSVSKETNFAAIDLGSNSFRLLAVSGLKVKWPPCRILLDTCCQARLAEELTTTDGISPAARRRGLAACREFVRQLRELPAMPLRVCGTQALRQAVNSREFIQEAEEILSCRVEILSSEQEAAYTLLGCQAGQKEGSRPLLLVDAGGGSTEIILSRRRQKPLIRSLPIGAVNLTERFFRAGINATSTAKMRIFLIEQIKPVFSELLSADLSKVRLAASGGTANALAMLSLRLRDYQTELIQGSRLTRDGLNKVMARLMILNPRALRSIPGLGERGAIIPAGIMLLQAVIDIAGQDLTVSTSGFLEGIVLSYGDDRAIAPCFL
ncbi:hypothetical protein ACOHYD_00950 [Desulfobacterota bacterium M19]